MAGPTGSATLKQTMETLFHDDIGAAGKSATVPAAVPKTPCRPLARQYNPARLYKAAIAFLVLTGATAGGVAAVNSGYFSGSGERPPIVETRPAPKPQEPDYMSHPGVKEVYDGMTNVGKVVKIRKVSKNGADWGHGFDVKRMVEDKGLEDWVVVELTYTSKELPDGRPFKYVYLMGEKNGTWDAVASKQVE
jgi:hypothetical protein